MSDELKRLTTEQLVQQALHEAHNGESALVEAVLAEARRRDAQPASAQADLLVAAQAAAYLDGDFEPSSSYDLVQAQLRAAIERAGAQAEQPITQEALKQAGWEYMQWNRLTDAWSVYEGDRIRPKWMVEVKYREWRNEPPDKPHVWIHIGMSMTELPHITTMPQLAALVLALTGKPMPGGAE